MLEEVLSGVVLAGTGTVTGVFVAVAVSVGPAMSAMGRAEYLRAHALLGKGYHPLMPVLVNIVTLSGFALAFLAGAPGNVLFPSPRCCSSACRRSHTSATSRSTAR